MTSHIGAQQDGADSFLMLNRTYTIPVTVESDGWLTAIEAELGSASTIALVVGVGVYEDDDGAPGKLIYLAQSTTQTSAAVVGTTLRWVSVAVGAWLPAGSYHLGVSNNHSSSPLLGRTTGGSSGDGHIINVSTADLGDPDYSSASVTASTDTYSIRGVFVVAAEEGITGTIAVTEADDTLTASGTVTAPTFTGSVDVTEADDTLSASGTFTPPAITGSIEATEADDLLSAVGQFIPETVTGTIAATEADDTLDASGTVTAPLFTGSIAVVEEADTLTAAGAITAVYSGSINVVEEDDVLVASGSLPGVPWYSPAPVGYTRNPIPYTPKRTP